MLFQLVTCPHAALSKGCCWCHLRKLLDAVVAQVHMLALLIVKVIQRKRHTAEPAHSQTRTQSNVRQGECAYLRMG